MLSRSVIPAGTAPEGKRGDLVKWRSDAACAGLPLYVADELWNPVSETKEADSEGLKYCWERCTVRERCLDWAFANEKRSAVYGILGGHTAAERRVMYRQAARERKAEKEAAEAAAKASKAA